MANISRNSFNESKQYDKVILQQGQPITDYDYNETQDIQRIKLRRLIIELFGDGAIEDGYKIVGTGAVNDFIVKAGPVYKSGYRINLFEDSTASALGVILNTPVSDRTDIVYLDIYEMEITSETDPDIIHPKLIPVGMEPTRRIKIKADLKVAEGTTLPIDTSTHSYMQLATINRTASELINSDMVIDNRLEIGITPLATDLINHISNNLKHKNSINCTETGDYANAEGLETVASGDYGSHAEGWNTKASGDESHAEGLYTEASGHQSHAEGDSTLASNYAAHAEGYETIASGIVSHAEGYSEAAGEAAHAEGVSIASGDYSHSEGFYTEALGDYSHAEGENTKALDYAAHSEGRYTTASSMLSHAEGENTLACYGTVYTITAFDDALKTITLDNVDGLAVGDLLQIRLIGSESTPALTDVEITNISELVVTLETTETITLNWAQAIEKSTTSHPAHAEGTLTLASGNSSHAEGYETLALGSQAHSEGVGTKAIGARAHAEGINTTAKGDYSHAEGGNTIVNGAYSHAEGRYSEVNGAYAHAEGYDTEANDYAAHAEGWKCQALENCAHAEGESTIASGLQSHAEGFSTAASGNKAHSQNWGTIAQGQSQTVIGEYNIPQGTKDSRQLTDHAFIVGNGSNNDNRSNAMSVNWAGDLKTSGEVEDGEGNALSNKSDKDHIHEVIDISNIELAAKNLFDNYYSQGYINTSTGVHQYSTNTRISIIPIEDGKTYIIQTIGAHNRFIVSVANSCAFDVPTTVLTNLSTTGDCNYQFTNSGNYQFLFIYVSNDSSTPELIVTCEDDFEEITISDINIETKKDSVILEDSLYYEIDHITTLIPTTHLGIYAIYDNLLGKYPKYVSKTVLGQTIGGQDIINYTFVKPLAENDIDLKKLKIVILSGLHGSERGAAFNTALFFKDLCENKKNNKFLNLLKANVEFKIIPVGNPYGYDANTRGNANSVDLNRNFPFGWEYIALPDINYSGESPKSELETQIICNFLDAEEPDYYIDFHNTGDANNVGISYFVASKNHKDNYEKVLKTKYSNVISILSNLYSRRYFTFPNNMVFGYSTTSDDIATSVNYALNIVGSKSVTLESTWEISFLNEGRFGAITTRFGVELLGNIIFEYYKDVCTDVIEVQTHVQEQDAKAAFIDAMNIKAQEIGMINSKFLDPHGLTGVGQLTTAYDIMLMGVYAVGYNDIVKIWNKKYHILKIQGENERAEIITTTVSSASLEDYYHIFGGKTGTIGIISNLLVLVNAPDNNWFVGAFLDADDTDRFAVAKAGFDIATLYMDPEYTGTHDISAEKVAMCLMPKHNPLSYAKFSIPLLWSKNETVLIQPASITKILTAIVMLDNITNLDEKIKIKASDITAGSGPIFQAGDIITFRDALYCMLLPSSNTIATAISRIIGEKIYKNNPPIVASEYTNILGSFGDCESTTDWVLANCTFEVDTTNKLTGNNCLKIIDGAGGTVATRFIWRDILSLLDITKHYLITANVKNGNTETGIQLTMYCASDKGLVSTSYNITTDYLRVGIVLKPEDIDAATAVQIRIYANGTENQYAYVDSIMVNEISANEAALGAEIIMPLYPFKI